MEDNEETEKKVEPTMIRPNPHRETTVYAKPGTLDANFFNNSLHTRKSSSCSLASSGGGTGHSGGPSFTQRLIERGVAVPSSFSTWDRARPSEDSSSPGSFDFDSYYGMSPFITPSFSTAAEAASHFHDGALYKSLHHRYEKERNLNNNSGSRVMSDDEEEDGGIMSSPDFIKRNPSSSGKRTENKKQRAEDSDIELSEEEECNNTDKLLSTSLFLLNQRSSRRSRSPLAFPVNSNHTAPGDGIFDLFDPHSYDTLEKQEEEEAPKGLSPSVERLKNFLITKPPKHQPKPLPKPPRKYLLQTPVFKVKHANTTKDKYLILFNDLLLICNPIMDENMIVGTSSTSSSRNNVKKNRYRFRPNENSLFQVKKIVQLGQLTLYISKEDYYSSTHHATQTIEIGPDGRPILPPARKIHPIMASALRKFETNANLSIQYLIDKGLLSHDPLSIANFLFKTPDLNRRQLGYYLSDLKNADVYNAFLECFRLVGLRLDEALRILLTTFRLPSNWESLEYLIERFAKKWHDANQNVIKFHEDMVVKVVVAMLFLNAECWYDATSERDVFWYARELKERQDRQAKRKMSVIDYHKSHTSPYIQTKSSSSATTSSSNNRQSVTIEPLHYIMALRERGNNQPSLDEFLERWNYYDQYHLVPREFMEEMYKSIMEERLETGWDNKTGKRIQNSNQDEFEDGVARPKVVSPSMKQGSQDVVITVIPHRLPTKLTEGMPSDPITISIPAPDKGLQIKLRGQDLVFKPNVLDFSDSCIQTFTITGNTLGRTSLMFIKTGENAGNYVSPTLPRTRSVVVEKAFMRYTFQIGFKHIKENTRDYSNTILEENKNNFIQKSLRDENDDNEEEEEYEVEGGTSKINENRKSHHIVNKRYTFSVETEEEKIQWLEALKRYGGAINEERNEENVRKSYEMSSESRVALQVLKEVLLSNETKKGTARTSNTTTINKNTNNTTTTVTGTNSTTNTPTIPTSVTNINTNIPLNNENISPIDDTDRGRTMRLLLPKKKNIEDSSIVTTSTTANVVTKRGHEIVKLVVQNSMVPLVLSFLKNQISS
ncbi:hypothetical protein BD770DRAFT_332406 [Pilaira anomala]|nr:hypothetical protein BD770DRAFT_332406 [Pilaira anomala]